MFRAIKKISLCVILSFFWIQTAFAEDMPSEQKGREIWGKFIPIPLTVSEELQKHIELPLDSDFLIVPENDKEWQTLINSAFEAAIPAAQTFPVTIKNEKISGVGVYMITPHNLSEEHATHLLLHTHGGGYVFGGGESGLTEAMAMAHYGKIKVLAIDYRMPPAHPFPAALDDTVTVYKEMIQEYPPEHLGFFGSSAGGGLIAAAMLKLKALNLPLPAVIGLGTPWTDLTKTGDTYFTNEEIDDCVVTYDGLLGARAKLYAGSHDIKDPYISPIYGDCRGFPPTILISGTRDLLLSCTVRMHRKLLSSGVEAVLHVFEGGSHAFYLTALDAPESKEVFEEMARFFTKYLQ